MAPAFRRQPSTWRLLGKAGASLHSETRSEGAGAVGDRHPGHLLQGFGGPRDTWPGWGSPGSSAGPDAAFPLPKGRRRGAKRSPTCTPPPVGSHLQAPSPREDLGPSGTQPHGSTHGSGLARDFGAERQRARGEASQQATWSHQDLPPAQPWSSAISSATWGAIQGG